MATEKIPPLLRNLAFLGLMCETAPWLCQAFRELEEEEKMIASIALVMPQSFEEVRQFIRKTGCDVERLHNAVMAGQVTCLPCI